MSLTTLQASDKRPRRPAFALLSIGLFLLLLNVSAVLGAASVGGSAGTTAVPLPVSIPRSIPNTVPYSAVTYPMGIADYGVNGGSAYTYTSQAFESWANFTSLKIGKASSGANHQMTIQQNLVDYVVGTHSGEYWTQDVPYITQAKTKYTVNLLDNIWNFSSSSAGMAGSDLTGNLLGECGSGGGVSTSKGYSWYWCEGSLQVTVKLPFEIEMVTTIGTIPSGTYAGDSDVVFSVAIYHSGTFVSSQTFDEVAFHSTAGGTASYHVGGKNPYGIYNDAETVLCGPGGGSSVPILAIGAKLSEAYYTGTQFASVPHAYSYGYDTAETVSGVLMSSSSFGVGTASLGTDNQIQLW